VDEESSIAKLWTATARGQTPDGCNSLDMLYKRHWIRPTCSPARRSAEAMKKLRARRTYNAWHRADYALTRNLSSRSSILWRLPFTPYWKPDDKTVERSGHDKRNVSRVPGLLQTRSVAAPAPAGRGAAAPSPSAPFPSPRNGGGIRGNGRASTGRSWWVSTLGHLVRPLNLKRIPGFNKLHKEFGAHGCVSGSGSRMDEAGLTRVQHLPQNHTPWRSRRVRRRGAQQTVQTSKLPVTLVFDRSGNQVLKRLRRLHAGSDIQAAVKSAL